jgi:hypothetical protein
MAHDPAAEADIARAYLAVEQMLGGRFGHVIRTRGR